MKSRVEFYNPEKPEVKVIFDFEHNVEKDTLDYHIQVLPEDTKEFDDDMQLTMGLAQMFVDKLTENVNNTPETTTEA